MPILRIVTGGSERRIILEASPVTLGRGNESDIQIEDAKTSRRHCQIVPEGGAYKVVDLGSGNGTRVNGAPVTERRLNHRDRIQIGQTLVEFIDEEAAAAAPPPQAAPATRPKPSAPAAPPKPATTQRPGPKPAPTPAGRPGSGTPTTARVAAPARPATGKAAPRKVSKAAQYAAAVSARRPRRNPFVIVGGIVGGIVVAFTLILFLKGDPEREFEEAKKKYQELMAQASKAEDDMDYTRAITLYQQAVEVVRENTRLKREESSITPRIEAARESKAVVDKLDKEFDDFDAEYSKKPRSLGVKELLERGRSLEFRCKQQNVQRPWTGRLNEALEQLQKEYSAIREQESLADFTKYSRVVNEKFNLASDREARWGPAIAEWKTFVENPKVTDKDRDRARDEVRTLEGRAKDLFRIVDRQARRKLSEEGKTSALQYCREMMDRLKGSEVEADLRRLTEEIEKK